KNRWEREASVRLRAGDQDALAEYDRRGRIRGGTREEMSEAAVNAYVADVVSGKQTMLLADTNEQAARLAGQIRERLVALGQVRAPVEGRVVERHERNKIAPGDRITARRNDAEITLGNGEEKRELTNRDVLEVQAILPDGRVGARLVD